MKEINLDIEYFINISEETALVDYKMGYSLGNKLRLNSKHKYVFHIPENIIAVTKTFLKGFLDGLENEKGASYCFKPDKFKIDEKIKQIFIDREYMNQFRESSYENDDLSSFLQDFINLKKLDEMIEKNGYITINDIKKYNFMFLIEKIILLNYYIDWNYNFFYIVQNERYETKNKIPKDQVKDSILCFEYSEDFLKSLNE